MKKTLTIFLGALLSATAFTACSDNADMPDEIGCTASGAVTILSRETSFPCTPSTGKIVVEASGPVTVTHPDFDWLSTSVDGNEITVNVSQNPGLYFRQAMLDIHCGTSSTQIAVIQEGFSFGVVGIDASGITAENAFEATYPLRGGVTPTVTTDADWITATVDPDNNLVVTLAANDSKRRRTGNITLDAAGQTVVIPVSQYSFDSCYAGDDYFLVYDDLDADGNPIQSSIPAAFDKSDSGYTLTLKYGPYTFPLSVDFDEETGTMSVYGGTACGKFGSYFLYSVILATDGYGSWSAEVYMGAKIQYTESNGNVILMAPFVDNGSYAGKTCGGFGLGAFKAASTSTANWAGTLLVFENAVLMRTL